MRWKDFQLFEKKKSTSVYFFLKIIWDPIQI